MVFVIDENALSIPEVIIDFRVFLYPLPTHQKNKKRHLLRLKNAIRVLLFNTTAGKLCRTDADVTHI